MQVGITVQDRPEIPLDAVGTLAHGDDGKIRAITQQIADGQGRLLEAHAMNAEVFSRLGVVPLELVVFIYGVSVS